MAARGAALGRLVIYLRILDEYAAEHGGNDASRPAWGQAGARAAAGDPLTISSREIAERAQVSSHQVRKDLTVLRKHLEGMGYPTPMGSRGSGYNVEELRRAMRLDLGLTRPWHIAIVGMGRLGEAIANYPNFNRYDFILKACFDVDESKIGQRHRGVEVAHPRDMARLVVERKIDIGMITVPQEAAQVAADALVEAGVKGILNFAPTVINVPEGVHVEPVDFLAGLKRLSFYIQKPQLKEELHEA